MYFKIIYSYIVLFLSTTSLVAQGELGDKVTDFTLQTESGSEWTLSKDFKSDFLIIYFYPAAMTGGCTAQACSYRDVLPDLQKEGAEVIAVSGDNIKNLQIFKKEYDLNFPLLSDPKGELAKQLGVPLRDGGTITRTVDGKEVELSRDITTQRWTFILDKKHRIVQKENAVKPGDDSKNMLKFITEFN